jgi:hypothetical protein
MRATLLCSVVAVSGVTTAFAAPAIDSRITQLDASNVSASYRSDVQTKLERSYLVGLERCYLREPKVRTDRAITREVVFEIELDGKVAVVSSSFAKAAQRCVADAVKRWQLGVPKDKLGAPIAAVFVAEIELGSPQALQAAQFASLLSADPGDAAQGEMSSRRPGAELGTQLAASQHDTGAVRAGDGRITLFDKRALDATTLGLDDVVKKLQVAYLAGVRRCYATRLATNPSLKGRVTLTLPVNETGRVVRPTSRGFDKEVDRCITGLMASWRFPAPRASNGDPASVRFTLGLAFTPD